MVKDKQTLVIAILGFIILALIAYVLPNIVITFNKNNENSSDNISITSSLINQNIVIGKIRNASISLVPVEPDKVYSVGDTAGFLINVEYGNNYIIGVDAIIDYNSSRVQVVKIQNSGSFDLYPLSTTKNNKIYVSGIMNPGNSINGVQTLATVSIKFLATGKSDFNIFYQPLQTTDSNIIPSGSSEDVLGKIENISFEVK